MNKLFGAVALATTFSWAAQAADYTLAAGETDEITTNVTYATMTIAGDLTVKSKVYPTTVNTTGGSVFVTGSSAAFSVDTAEKPAYTVQPDANGAMTKFIADRGLIRFGSLSLTADDAWTTDDGIFDFLTITNATVQFRRLYNNTSLTGRVTVVGKSTINRPSGFSSTGAFAKGAYRVRLVDGANLTFDPTNQRGWWNDAGVTVETEGTGNIIFTCRTDTLDGSMRISEGAYFNHKGALVFSSSYAGWYTFAATNSIGPNVTRVYADPNSAVQNFFIPKNTAVNVAGFEFPAKAARFLGRGTLLLDATKDDIAFEGTVKPYAVTGELTSTVVLRKIGINEACVTSTNLNTTVVEEGVLRFVNSNCTVRKLEIATGANVIVDGVTLYLADLSSVRGGTIQCVNGGKVAKTGSGQSYLYDAPSVSGSLEVNAGTLVCSKYGSPYRRYRWWLRDFNNKTSGNVGGWWFGVNRLWLFGDDGSHACTSYGYITPDATIAAGKIKFTTDGSWTPTQYKDAASWWGISQLSALFRGVESTSSNNLPGLTPTEKEITPDDESTWLAVEWEQKTAEKAIVGFNVCRNTAANYPVSWKLQGYDEENDAWVTVHEVATGEVAPATVSNDNYLDGWSYYDKTAPTMPFVFSNYKTPGLTGSTTPFNVKVAPGAALDLTAYTESAQTISRITIDATTGGGAISGGTLAAEGTLVVENAEQLSGQIAQVAITLTDTESLANLANWKLVILGKELTGAISKYEGGKIIFKQMVYVASESGEAAIMPVLSGGDLLVSVASGVTFTNTAPFAGSGKLVKIGTGDFVLPAGSTYEGGTSVEEGRLVVRYSDALGTGDVTLAGGATGVCGLVFDTIEGAIAITNDITLAAASSATYPAFFFRYYTGKLKALTFEGDITALGNLYMADNIDSTTPSDTTLLTFNGDIDAEGQTIRHAPGCAVYFNGDVCAAVLRDDAGYPHCGIFIFNSKAKHIGRIVTAYTRYYTYANNVLPGTGVQFLGGEAGSRGALFLFNHNQELGYISGGNGKPADEKVFGFTYSFHNSNTETVTLVGGVERASASVWITSKYVKAGQPGDSLTLIVDDKGADGTFEQILTNSVIYSRGALKAKRGQLTLAGTTTATNVPSVVIEAEGRMRFAARNPFGEQGVTTAEVKAELALPATEDALDIPAGNVAQVAKATVNGKKLRKGSYTGDPDAATESVLYLPQLTGSGVLTVLDDDIKGVFLMIH